MTDSNADDDWCKVNPLNVTAPMSYYFSNSGKSPNDYGLYDNCQSLTTIPDLVALSPPVYLRYDLTFAGVLPFQWGFCLPSVCFETFDTYFRTSVQNVSMSVVAVSMDNLEPISMSDGRTITMIILTSLLVLLGFIGLIIENTSLGNKP